MALTFNIPDKIFVRVHDSTSDIVKFGKFVSTKDGALENINVGFFKNNCTGLFRIRLHTSKDATVVYAASSWIDISTAISDLIYTGNLRFDFANTYVNLNKTYWVTAEANTYTRTANTSYMSWVHDKPSMTNVLTANWPTDHPIRMGVFIR